MQHLSVEDLIRYIDEEQGVGVSSHLTVCAQCHSLHQEIAHFLKQVANDSEFEPPKELVQWAVDLFQPIQRSAGNEVETVVSRLRRFVATLVFDNYDEPLPAGMRGGGVPSRQLLFRAGAVDIDVKIESLETDGRISLAGQVLSNSPAFFDNTPVKLESRGVVRFRTTTNPVGEFAFDEVPKDTYHLCVDLPEGELTIFCVHRGNS